VTGRNSWRVVWKAVPCGAIPAVSVSLIALVFEGKAAPRPPI
jgi:hypothetical protein